MDSLAGLDLAGSGRATFASSRAPSSASFAEGLLYDEEEVEEEYYEEEIIVEEVEYYEEAEEDDDCIDGGSYYDEVEMLSTILEETEDDLLEHDDDETGSLSSRRSKQSQKSTERSIGPLISPMMSPRSTRSVRKKLPAYMFSPQRSPLEDGAVNDDWLSALRSPPKTPTGQAPTPALLLPDLDFESDNEGEQLGLKPMSPAILDSSSTTPKASNRRQRMKQKGKLRPQEEGEPSDTREKGQKSPQDVEMRHTKSQIVTEETSYTTMNADSNSTSEARVESSQPLEVQSPQIKKKQKKKKEKIARNNEDKSSCIQMTQRLEQRPTAKANLRVATTLVASGPMIGKKKARRRNNFEASREKLNKALQKEDSTSVRNIRRTDSVVESKPRWQQILDRKARRLEKYGGALRRQSYEQSRALFAETFQNSILQKLGNETREDSESSNSSHLKTLNDGGEELFGSPEEERHVTLKLLHDRPSQRSKFESSRCSLEQKFQRVVSGSMLKERRNS